MKGRELRRHLEAADRHEHAALSHDRAADFWAGHDDDARAALQRELAEHERRGAQLERRWAELVDGPAAASDQPPPPRARAAPNRRRRVGDVKVKGIRWIGVGTADVARMRSFAVDVLGMRVAGQDAEDFVELAMGDGTKLELFGGAGAADGPWLFASNPVVAGFLVDDIEAARDELARTPDVELLGDLRVMPDGYAWQHFRAPDGHVYELTADPAAG